MARTNKLQTLKNSHQDKLIELYNTYYNKCLDGDTASLKAFLDCSKELFSDNEESELIALLRDTTLGD